MRSKGGVELLAVEAISSENFSTENVAYMKTLLDRTFNEKTEVK